MVWFDDPIVFLFFFLQLCLLQTRAKMFFDREKYGIRRRYSRFPQKTKWNWLHCITAHRQLNGKNDNIFYYKFGFFFIFILHSLLVKVVLLVTNVSRDLVSGRCLSWRHFLLQQWEWGIGWCSLKCLPCEIRYQIYCLVSKKQSKFIYGCYI